MSHLKAARDDAREVLRQFIKAQQDGSFDVEHDAGTILAHTVRGLLNTTAVYLDPDALLSELRMLCDVMRDGGKKKRLAAAGRFAELFSDLDDLISDGGARPADWHPFDPPVVTR